jgi:hypothetical protein
MENFAAIDAAFRAAGAVVTIESPNQLSAAVVRLLDDKAAAAQIGEAGRKLAESERGATARVAEEVVALYQKNWPQPLPWLSARLLLTPLTWLWRAGGHWKRSRTVQRRLAIPVISIGGLSMGGVGKTPVTALLAKRLREAGQQAAILTRGYGRRSPVKKVVLRAGQDAPSELTGDEAQEFIRHGDAHLGIGADRYQVGRLLLEQLPAKVALLDDGFQHAALARDLDVVLIDTMDRSGFRWGGFVKIRRRWSAPT